MASSSKTNGETTRRNLKEACKRLRCTDQQFLLSVSAAVKSGTGRACDPGDAGCVNEQALPYIKAVLDGKQKRLPLAYIVGKEKPRGKSPRVASVRQSQAVRV